MEANRRKQKEMKLLMEEKAKLQKMKWDELEKYLGNQATAVQEFRALTWEKMSLQREMGRCCVFLTRGALDTCRSPGALRWTHAIHARCTRNISHIMQWDTA